MSNSRVIIRIAVGVTLSVLLLVGAWALLFMGRVTVFVNGKQIKVKEGTNAGTALKKAGYSRLTGDLIDVDGNVIARGRGSTPRLKINGAAARIGAKVEDDDKLVFKAGSDKTEDTRTSTQQIFPPVKSQGSGKFTKIVSPGKAGHRLIIRGELSGKIKSRKVVSNGEPMILARTETKPEKVFALTFDDGPGKNTRPIMKILEKFKAPATFFVLGRKVNKSPKTIRMLKDAGFQLGNHSYSHTDLGQVDQKEIGKEIDATNKALLDAAGYKTRIFRPPAGILTPTIEKVAERKGYQVVMWNIDSRDWAFTNPQKIVNRVVDAAQPGAISIMHDGYEKNRKPVVEALPQIIWRLYEEGYTFVTVDQLNG